VNFRSDAGNTIMLQTVYTIFNILAIFFIIFMNDCAASTNMPQQCEITPEISLLKTPPQIHKNNNLRRVQGKTEFAEGQAIILTGMVLDANCVPIGDAIVEIWQANSKGGIDYLTEYQPPTTTPNPMLDELFTGSGMTVTDNIGRYHFLTVLPGIIDDKRAPHINIRVKHRDFGMFESILYFDNQILNDSDAVLQENVPAAKRHILVASSAKVDPQQYSLPKDIGNDFTMYKMNITLPIKHKYKSY